MSLRKGTVKYISVLLFFVFLIAGKAQAPPPIQEQLHRLRMELRQLEYFLQIVSQTNAHGPLQQKLELAWQEWHKADQLVRQKKFYQARLHLQIVRDILISLQRMIRNHPFFRFRFKQDLDRRIQEAERRAQQLNIPQVFHLIDQAKFFRHRAIQAIQRNRLLVGMEFYRLALFFVRNALQIMEGRGAVSGQDFEKLRREADQLLNRLEFLQLQKEISLTASEIQRWKQELDKAHRLYQSGQKKRAISQLQAMLHMLYNRFQSLEGATPQVEELKHQFQLAKENFRQVQAQLPSNLPPYQQVLFRRIQRMLQDVGLQLQRGKFKAARARLMVVNRLLYQLQHRQFPNRLQENIANELQQAYRNLESLKKETADIPESAGLIEIVKQALERAQQAEQSHHPLLAARYLRLANQLMAKFYQMITLGKNQQLSPSQIKNQFQRAQALVNRIEKRNPNPVQRANLQVAKRILQSAQEFYRNKRYSEAFELVRFAIQLLTNKKWQTFPGPERNP